MGKFLSRACHRCDGVRTATLMFEFQAKIPEIGGLARLGELIPQGEMQSLPAPLSPNGNLPARARLGIIVHDLEDCTMRMCPRFFALPRICRMQWTGTLYGQCLFPFFRQGPQALRKAIQHLPEGLPGYRLLWNHVVQKQQPIQRNSSSQWTPDVDSLKAGIDYINAHAPEEDTSSMVDFNRFAMSSRDDATKRVQAKGDNCGRTGCGCGCCPWLWLLSVAWFWTAD
eukprot:s1345_g1.t1